MTPRPEAWSRPWALVTTAALLATLTACGGDGDAEEPGPDTDAYAEVETTLEEMPGIADATAAAERLDEETWNDHVDVRIEEDTTAEEVADALDRVADGFDITVRLASDEGAEDWEAPTLEAQGTHQALKAQAAQFISATTTFPGARIDVDTAGVHILFITGRDDPAPVTRAARDLAGDPTMEDASIEIHSSAAGRDGYQLVSSHGIDNDLVDAWERSIAAFETLPGDAYAPRVWLEQQHGGIPKSGIGPARTVTARVYFGGTEPTPARHGLLLRPVVRALLGGVLPQGSPGELQLHTTDEVFLGLTTDGSAPDRRGTPAWRAWAAEQL